MALNHHPASLFLHIVRPSSTRLVCYMSSGYEGMRGTSRDRRMRVANPGQSPGFLVRLCPCSSWVVRLARKSAPAHTIPFYLSLPPFYKYFPLSTFYNALLSIISHFRFSFLYSLSCFLFSYRYSYLTLLTTTIHVHSEPLHLNCYSRCLWFPLQSFALLEFG